MTARAISHFPLQADDRRLLCTPNSLAWWAHTIPSLLWIAVLQGNLGVHGQVFLPLLGPGDKPEAI